MVNNKDSGLTNLVNTANNKTPVVDNQKQLTGFEALMDFVNNKGDKALSTVGRALELGANKNQGQMVGGIYVPTSGLNLDVGSALNEEFAKEQALREEQAMQEDRSFRNLITAMNANTSNTIANSKLAKEAEAKQQQKVAEKLDTENLVRDKENIKKVLDKAAPDLGNSPWKKLKRSAVGIILPGGSDARQAIADMESSVANFFSKNIRKLPAYKQGVLTDADFNNAVKGAFNPDATLETNIDNFNSTMREMFASKGLKMPKEMELSTSDFSEDKKRNKKEIIG